MADSQVALVKVQDERKFLLLIAEFPLVIKSRSRVLLHNV